MPVPDPATVTGTPITVPAYGRYWSTGPTIPPASSLIAVLAVTVALAALLACWRATRRRPQPGATCGYPARAKITPAGCGGFLLFVEYRHWEEPGNLPDRCEEYDGPDEREFTAAAAILAACGVRVAGPWHPHPTEPGAVIAPTVSATTPAASTNPTR